MRYVVCFAFTGRLCYCLVSGHNQEITNIQSRLPHRIRCQTTWHVYYFSFIPEHENLPMYSLYTIPRLHCLQHQGHIYKPPGIDTRYGSTCSTNTFPSKLRPSLSRPYHFTVKTILEIFTCTLVLGSTKTSFSMHRNREK